MLFTLLVPSHLVHPLDDAPVKDHALTAPEPEEEGGAHPLPHPLPLLHPLHLYLKAQGAIMK